MQQRKQQQLITQYEKIDNAKDKAIKGGLAGAMAMTTNVMTLMWMRTTVLYQYRHGTSFRNALYTLYNHGGIPRFYRGLTLTLIQAPLLRFGDTASNTGMLTFLNSNEETKNLPVSIKTMAASIAASSFRIVLMPIDTIKVNMQVMGSMKPIYEKIKMSGIPSLYHGSLAAGCATLVGHYPWYFTFNYLDESFPETDNATSLDKLKRRAMIGFCSSLVSDTCSNFILVLKVNKQSRIATDTTCTLSYSQIVQKVIAESGIKGLLFRGLETKILSNGLQGMLFTVVWKHLEDLMFRGR